MIRRPKKNDIPEFTNQEPKLNEFGYTEESINSDKRFYEIEKDRIQNIFVSLLILICLALIIYFFIKFIQGHDDFLLLAVMFFSAVFTGGSIGLLISLFTLMPIQAFFEDKLEKKYSKMINYYAKLEAYNYWEQRSQIEFWQSLSGVQFEKELAELFKLANYNVSLTKSSGDRGIDIILTYDSQITIVQCKAHKNQVGPAIAREIFGALIDSKSDSAILAATNGFSKGVYEFCKDKNIDLWDINRIIEFKRQLKVN